MSNDPNLPNVSEVCVESYARICRIHNIYKRTLMGFAQMCVSEAIFVSKDDIACFAEAIGETLAGEAEYDLKLLNNSGDKDITYTPDNSEKLIDDAYQYLVNGFRPKSINYGDELLNALSQPRMVTNTETLQAMGRL